MRWMQAAQRAFLTAKLKLLYDRIDREFEPRDAARLAPHERRGIDVGGLKRRAAETGRRRQRNHSRLRASNLVPSEAAVVMMASHCPGARSGMVVA